MTLKKAISIFCIVIFNLTNALAYSETIVSEPVSLIHRYLINYLFSFIWKNIFYLISQDKITSAAKSVMIPIPCILFDLRLRELIFKKIMEQASNKCHSNEHGYGYLRIQELIH